MRVFAAAVALVLSLATAAFGDAYPTRPITIIVPFAAGGPPTRCRACWAHRCSTASVSR